MFSGGFFFFLHSTLYPWPHHRSLIKTHFSYGMFKFKTFTNILQPQPKVNKWIIFPLAPWCSWCENVYTCIYCLVSVWMASCTTFFRMFKDQKIEHCVFHFFIFRKSNLLLCVVHLGVKFFNPFGSKKTMYDMVCVADAVMFHVSFTSNLMFIPYGCSMLWISVSVWKGVKALIVIN